MQINGNFCYSFSIGFDERPSNMSWSFYNNTCLKHYQRNMIFPSGFKEKQCVRVYKPFNQLTLTGPDEHNILIAMPHSSVLFRLS